MDRTPKFRKGTNHVALREKNMVSYCLRHDRSSVTKLGLRKCVCVRARVRAEVGTLYIPLTLVRRCGDT